MLRIGPIVFILMILLLTVAVAGGQLLVSQDGTGGFRTIQGAIDAAHYGDLIYVNPGVYEEHVFLKDGITLVGAGPGSRSRGRPPSLRDRLSSSIRHRSRSSTAS